MTRALAFTLILGTAGTARADDVDVQLFNQPPPGEKPALILAINRDIARLTVELRRSDNELVSFAAKRLSAGTTKRYVLPAPAGRTQFIGTLDVKFTDGSGGSMPLSFTVDVPTTITIDVPYERLDLDAARLQLQLSRPAGYCEHHVWIEDRPERQGRTDFKSEPPGTWLTVSWGKHTEHDVVLKIRLKCADTQGYWSGVELFPWWLDVPHDDVVFETGKWEVRSGEVPKLERALADIQTAIRRYGEIITITLFVAGYTDTVGDKASNRTLSLRRARAIAQWLSDHGIRAPIRYAGFGESDPAVPTGDETAEQRNRRARYILGVNAPEPADWRSL